MAIGIFVGILIAILFGVCIAVAVGNDGTNDFVSGVAIIVAIALVISFVFVPFSFHTVSSGEVAVVKHLGKIEDVKTAGTHFDLWATNKYIKYDTKVVSLETQTAAYSSDAQTMDIQMTVQYQINADKVIDIATQYGKLSVLENRINSIALEKTKSIIANRASISPAVEEAIKAAVGEEYYVNIVAVVITNIDFSDSFERAVEDKMIAEQAKLKADYENDTKVAKAEAEAEAELKAAQAKIEIAKAEAEALKIAAEAEAEANTIITNSITDQIIDKTIADAWDGKLPAVVGGTDSGIMLPSDVLG